MNIHTKPFSDITFQDIVDLCNAGTLEDTVLDYKSTVPTDLSKHIAAFANTLGGIIVIGVDEDPKTGKPIKYDGLVVSSKEVDRIHQFAAGVRPFPRYDVRLTNESNGKAFILVKIFQGDSTPYMSVKDPGVKIRTGNVTSPLKNADTSELNKLYERRTLAAKSREDALIDSQDVCFQLYENTVDETVEGIMGPNLIAPISYEQLDSPLLRISILPFAPSTSILDYRQLLDRVGDYRVANSGPGVFPNYEIGTVTKGLYSFQGGKRKRIEYGFVSEQGLIDLIEDPATKSAEYGNVISISVICDRLIRQIKVARQFYKKVAKYNGLLHLNMSLSNIEGFTPWPIIPEGGHYFPDDEDGKVLMSSFDFEIELDTHELFDNEIMKEKISSIISRVYWSFGLADDYNADISDRLTLRGL